MRRMSEYSHFGGAEILTVRHQAIGEEIDKIVADVGAGVKGKELESRFKAAFHKYGYRPLTSPDTGNSDLETDSDAPAFERIDLAKEKVMVSVCLDKPEMVFADMARFQHFYCENLASVGVVIMGACEPRTPAPLVERLKRHFPAVPVKVILIDV